MSGTPDDTGRIPDAMEDGTPPEPVEHWSSDSLPETPSNTPHTHAQNTCSTMANPKNQVEPPETVVDDTLSGGRGDGLLSDPYRTATDLNMTRKAIRCGWNIPDAAKPRIVNRLVKIVDDNPDDGDAIKAASVLRAMDAQDQDLAIKEHELERVDNGQQNQAIKLYGIGTPIDDV
jgi:hypothetical protein